MTRPDYDRHLVAEARLDILRELDRQPDRRLSEIMIAHSLYALGHNRSREWLRGQLRWLAEMSAVAIEEDGSVLIVSLCRTGEAHLAKRPGSRIEGVAQP